MLEGDHDPKSALPDARRFLSSQTCMNLPRILLEFQALAARRPPTRASHDVRRPNNSLMLTRLAGGNAMAPCLPRRSDNAMVAARAAGQHRSRPFGVWE